MSHKWYDKKNKYGGRKNRDRNTNGGQVQRTDYAPVAAAPVVTAVMTEDDKPLSAAGVVSRNLQTDTTFRPEEKTPYLKLHEVQSFACKGIDSGADGGYKPDQQEKALLGLMYQLGQFAREMAAQPRGEPSNAMLRKRIGAMVVHCAELAILSGTSLDAAVAERVNEMCSTDRRYDKPSSML